MQIYSNIDLLTHPGFGYILNTGESRKTELILERLTERVIEASNDETRFTIAFLLYNNSC